MPARSDPGLANEVPPGRGDLLRCAVELKAVFQRVLHWETGAKRSFEACGPKQTLGPRTCRQKKFPNLKS